jgi:hypothetical protein
VTDARVVLGYVLGWDNVGFLVPTYDFGSRTVPLPPWRP